VRAPATATVGHFQKRAAQIKHGRYLLSGVRGLLAVLHDALVQRRLELAGLVGRGQQRAQPGVRVRVAVSEARVAGGDGRGGGAVGGGQEGALPAVRVRAVLGRDLGVALRSSLGRVEEGGPHGERVAAMDS
jgi:hypothetical protein